MRILLIVHGVLDGKQLNGLHDDVPDDLHRGMYDNLLVDNAAMRDANEHDAGVQLVEHAAMRVDDVVGHGPGVQLFDEQQCTRTRGVVRACILMPRLARLHMMMMTMTMTSRSLTATP